MASAPAVSTPAPKPAETKAATPAPLDMAAISASITPVTWTTLQFSPFPHCYYYQIVAKAIFEADALLYTTGAGMGVASGLGTFRGVNAGVWPPLVKHSNIISASVPFHIQPLPRS
jgi:hypothetical protein